MARMRMDWRDPLAAFAPLSGLEGAALLHGGARARGARWSFIAAFPVSVFECRRGRVFIDGEARDGAPFETLRRFHRARRRALAPDAPPLSTGLVGFVSYEAGALLEPTAEGPASPYDLPDIWFGAYDAIAAFDRARREAFIFGRSESAAERLDAALGNAPAALTAQPDFGAPACDFTRAGYEAAVAEIVERIAAGAVFQVNLARRLTLHAKARFDPFSLFQRLAEGDAPMAAYIRHARGAIVSNSPERFFRAAHDDGGLRITAEPVKGTRPRGRDRQEDERLAAELLADAKERAENVMIADLARNDMSRVCEDFSIREEAICALDSFETVHHLVSRISGRLRAGLGAPDALAAMFPCGSITGAPKIEAMRAIAALEPAGRGPYCGAIGYFDDAGGADFSVAIRTMIVDADETALSFGAGGGVTLRSDPYNEYMETAVKARGLLAVLGAADIE